MKLNHAITFPISLLFFLPGVIVRILLLTSHTRPTDLCDYLVMSTHKWLGNVKTAGIVVYADSVAPPLPPAISFGYDKGILLHGDTVAQVR